MKKCPFCAEDIQDQAILCRYCSRDVRVPVQPPSTQQSGVSRVEQWRTRRGGVALAAFGFLATFTGATGFGFALLWLGLWLALPGTGRARAAIAFVIALFLLAPSSAVRTQESTHSNPPEWSSSSTRSAVMPIRHAPPASSRFEIVSVDSRIASSNDVFSKFAWELVLGNDGDEALTCRATLEFLDADGNVVDADNEYDLRVPPNQEERFTGDALLTASDAETVQKTLAKARCR